MATPITSIKKQTFTDEEIQQEKLEELQSLVAEQEEALGKMLQITGELDAAGLLDAAQAMVTARNSLSKIGIDQASREPVKNAVNHFVKLSGLFTSIDPETTSQLVKSIESGFQEAELYGQDEKKIGLIELMKLLNDPDVNRAVKYGAHFLKGIGKGLSENE